MKSVRSAVEQPRTLTTRRRFLAGGAAWMATPFLPSCVTGLEKERTVRAMQLVAAPATAQLADPTRAPTGVWAYNGTIPGPVLRARQGDRLRIEVENRLEQPTTVHWHGVRVPNAMDGVPHITQAPIEPGDRYVYEFALPDAGTYWYHPHHRSYEQSGRGLNGLLIVEEREPIRVDREIVWLLQDWRLDREAAIVEPFRDAFDVTHAGRIGNFITINGEPPKPLRVRSGERVRLRIVNAANARVFALEFRGHQPMIVALDGQPVTPHDVPQGKLVLGSAMRADLVIDLSGQPGSRYEVHDTFYPRASRKLLDLVYSGESPLRWRPPDWPLAIAPNALPEPELERARQHEVVLSGGMMGDMRGLPRGMAWAINGKAMSCGTGQAFDPLVWLKRGETCVLRLVNDTAWPHPIHLHGHVFRVLTRNGRAAPHREWLDTVLLQARETAEIAFVADNPGDWMFHCHVLEHQEGGMMACVRVA